MDIVFLGIVIFLFILAVFDLSVGVSNDAVNFLNSAIGSKAASFKKIVIIASVGVFVGAVMSNGMMDIARHGIFRPEQFSFFDLMCIFMAVMVTDIILLDVFNSLGMPTSTTVSMVFELLGATFALSLLKIAGDTTGLTFNDLLNTEKALSVILGIFLSVAIAFVFGTVVQFLARTIFSFEYKSRMKWKAGLFGGIAVTALLYFMLIKGVKGMAFMTPEVKEWIDANTLLILGVSFAFFTLLMQGLHALGVNVLKVVVLTGTFALAMAFAGNDLVNLIGVPLSGLSSFQDYTANGSGDPYSHLMGALNGPADTPFYFLLGAGVIMVVSLATSKKARNVTKTEIGLGSKSGGDEMFGSSGIARRLVRMALSVHSAVIRYMPRRLRLWIDKRFSPPVETADDGAAFDLVRASVNLMLAGMLIALGTSLKLPLSTTFVTFMVAMGTSLADRAWGRESAVFRITGVISVIGGWFITAGVAFIGAALIASLMHWGGNPVMILAGMVAIILLVRSNIRYKRKKEQEKGDTMFDTIISTTDREECWSLLKVYLAEEYRRFLGFAESTYAGITDAFVRDDSKPLGRVSKALDKEKALLKSVRRKETVCMRRIPHEVAVSKNTWFHLANNSCMAMNYNLWRITEVCKEHVENNFRPLPKRYHESFESLVKRIIHIFSEAANLVGSTDADAVGALRKSCDRVKDSLSAECRKVFAHLREEGDDTIAVSYVYLNLLQESQEMVSALRKLLRASLKLHVPQGENVSLTAGYYTSELASGDGESNLKATFGTVGGGD